MITKKSGITYWEVGKLFVIVILLIISVTKELAVVEVVSPDI